MSNKLIILIQINKIIKDNIKINELVINYRVRIQANFQHRTNERFLVWDLGRQRCSFASESLLPDPLILFSLF